MPHPDSLQECYSVLAINAGSSSIKFSLFDTGNPPQRLLDGAIDAIGAAASCFHVTGKAAFSRRFPISDHVTAVRVLADWLGEHRLADRLTAIGHRVVYGGTAFQATQLVSPALIDAMFQASSYDCEHLPQERLLIETLRHLFPAAAHVVCFDSAFHSLMPKLASMLPIPRKFHDAGVVRSGFHGLSCAFMMRELGRLAGQGAANGKVVLAHLGSGCSMTAVEQGLSRDTSMGLTPAGGMMMASRSGEVDPGLGWRLLREHGVSPAQFNHMVHHDAGLKGVSGISGDLRVLLEKEASHPGAAEAVAMFCYQARKTLCAMTGALEGLDTLVFAGGVGEHLAVIRSRICAGLAFLGIELDPEQNALHAQVISTRGSRVTVRVMQTDEQWVIAHEVGELLGWPRPGAQAGGAQ